jgi:hypothetical protein
MSNPFDALHAALASAEHRDMPDVVYKTRDWDAYRKLSADEKKKWGGNIPDGLMIEKIRRPYVHELEVDMFLQGWGSTALGYPGIGGSAMTDAYTVVVSYGHRQFCVYFGAGGVLAYKVDLNKMAPTGRAAFMSDLKDHCLVDVQKAANRYV